MKLDVNVLRYLSKEDFRVLTAVEMGQKNHEIVPMQLIDSISGLKHGGAFRCLKTLLQHKLVHHDGSKYDGYRLTYMGYDFLAIKALVARGHISGVGRQIGVGKESDIFEVTNDDGEVFALKLHRLGRTSFRDVKSKRDYLGTRSSYSWLYLSRLAALKEFAFMKALGDHGFPVPAAVDNNRHAVLMELVDGQPLVQVRRLANPGSVYGEAMELIHRLAARGLIHCDFNEFNLLIDDEEALTLIDFPQMVSVSHPNARELFERDVDCIVRFFTKKLGYVPQLDERLRGPLRPSFDAAAAEAAAAGASGLDVELAASGFNRQQQRDLEAALAAADEGEEGEQEGEEEEEEEGSEEEGSEEAGGGSGSADAADALAERLAAVEASSSGGGGGGGGGGGESSRGAGAGGRRPGGRASASTQRWLEEHAADGGGGGRDGGGSGGEEGSSGSSSEEGGSEEGGSGSEGEAPPGAGGSCREDGAAAAQRQQQQQQQQQQPQQRQPQEQPWDSASVARSRAATDVSFMGREVQLRLVRQRQREAARTTAARAGRNVSKAKGKKARKTAAAMADW